MHPREAPLALQAELSLTVRRHRTPRRLVCRLAIVTDRSRLPRPKVRSQYLSHVHFVNGLTRRESRNRTH